MIIITHVISLIKIWVCDRLVPYIFFDEIGEIVGLVFIVFFGFYRYTKMFFRSSTKSYLSAKRVESYFSKESPNYYR